MIPGIAISGRAGAGKSSFARELHAAIGRSEVFAFADPLKAYVREHYGLEKYDEGGREKLLEVGETARAEDPDVWIRPALANATRLRYHGLVPIIDDLRTTREYRSLERDGWWLIRVAAPVETRRRRLAEQGLDPEFATADVPNETDLEDDSLTWSFRVWNHDSTDLAHFAEVVSLRLQSQAA